MNVSKSNPYLCIFMKSFLRLTLFLFYGLLIFSVISRSTKLTCLGLRNVLCVCHYLYETNFVHCVEFKLLGDCVVRQKINQIASNLEKKTAAQAINQMI